MSASNKGPGVDSRLQNLTNALYVDGNNDIVVRTGFAGNIVISGNVNVPGVINVQSSPEDPVDIHIRQVGTSGILATPWLPIAGNVRLDAGTNSIGNVRITDGSVTVTNFPAFPSNISISQMPGITGNVGVSGNVSISQLPGITVTNFPSNVNITSMPGITGNVTATITDVITVVVNEDAGEIFGLNNHATAVHRGWTMDDTMRPVISVRLNPATTTSASLMKIIEYEIGNNNANQSTIMYEWYEGDLTIAGAAVPAWSAVNASAATQYRVYQDQYSSNQGNTFTIPSGTALRHSGIIIGKNTSGDGIDKPLTGGATGKIWTLCMKRLDNATKLDVWFAFTFKEIT